MQLSKEQALRSWRMIEYIDIWLNDLDENKSKIVLQHLGSLQTELCPFLYITDELYGGKIRQTLRVVAKLCFGEIISDELMLETQNEISYISWELGNYYYDLDI